jgi:transcriptional regulator with XRE-family HTH domain
VPRKKTAITRAFGCAIRDARRERGFGQEAFAAHAGMDRSYVGAIERGEFNVSLETMARLAAGLDTNVSQLLARARL